MFYVHGESPRITHCCDSVPRDVPLCDSLWNILRCTAQRYTFRTLNTVSLLCTGMTHNTVHPCCSYNRQVLVTAVFRATSLFEKADGIPTVLGCMAAVRQVLPYSSQLSVWSLCEALEPQNFSRMWLFRIVRLRRCPVNWWTRVWSAWDCSTHFLNCYHCSDGDGHPSSLW
jgi:hypothetical protein